jgi:cysteine-rich repeat protein
MIGRSLILLALAIPLACLQNSDNTPAESVDSGRPSDAGVTPDAGDSRDVGDIVSQCGDGALSSSEACDDGNTTAGDGCSPACAIEHGTIELGQAEPEAVVSQPILIRGLGFRYAATLGVCIMQDGQCRFELASLQSDDQGRVTGPDGQPVPIQAEQALEAEIGLCDEEIGACSNSLALRWVVPSDECAQDSDCARQQQCTDGRCVAASRPCTDDIECPPGHTCQEGACVDPSQGPCENNGQCPQGVPCVNGRCTEPQRGCTSHNDCPLHQACDRDEGMCVILPGTSCREDQQCQIRCAIAQGETLGRCIDCESDEHCPQGAICFENVCVEPSCNEQNCPPPAARCENDLCVGDVRCNEQTCPPPSRCENNQCVHNNQPQICQNHGQCQADEQCLMIGPQGACVNLCNIGHQQRACAGNGNAECICNMVGMSCNHQTGFCE